MLFEQTAICYLLFPKPLLRKFALFMIFSGSRYLLSKQMSHSFRCYMYSIVIYEGNWKEVNDHLNATISQLSYFMKDLKVSVDRIRNLLKNCTEEPEKQKTFLLDFIKYATV
jgi:trafficking protein particle complex subunit 8